MNGFLNIDKPEGITSAEVVRVIKRVLHPKKIGYIGTLDPIATGVLPIGMGKATKLFPFLEKGDKAYEATLTLGSSTDTQDRTGKVIDSADPSGISEDAVREGLAAFEGEIEQLPPMFSAKKINGERLYKLAREGKVVERKAIKATIKDMTFISKEGPDVRFSVVVSTGAYVRTLCHDLGEKLGVHAHLKDLIRTRAGNFSIENSVKLAVLEEGGDEALEERLISLADGLDTLSKVVVVAHTSDRLQNGHSVGVSEIVSYEDVPGAVNIRIVNKRGKLIAIGTAEGLPIAGFPFTSIQPKKVLL